MVVNGLESKYNNIIEFYIAPIIDDRNIQKDNWFTDEVKIGKVMSEVEKIGRYFAKHISDLVEKPR